MDFISSILSLAGVPGGVAAILIFIVIAIDRFLKHSEERIRIHVDEERLERSQFSSDQSNFRKDLIAQVEGCKTQIAFIQNQLNEALERHHQCEERLSQFQIVVARLIATLVKNGIEVPAGANLHEHS